MPERPILLLDVMDTLVHDPFFAELLGFLSLTSEELRSAKDFAAWIAFEEGRIDEAEYLGRFFLDRRPVDAEGLRACLRSAYRTLAGVDELLAELAAHGLAMHALSNYSSWYLLIEEELKLSRWLEWTFVSCRTGVRKPAPEAYAGAARALGVAPGRCLFVDDREGNCAAARAVGMEAVLFSGAAGLRAELVRRGVLPA